MKAAIFLLAMSVHVAFAQGHLTKDSSGHMMQCSCETFGRACACRHWNIDWKKPDGRVWGASGGESIAAVERNRDNSVAFERRCAAFFHRPFDPDYASPSEPYCSGCSRANRAKSRSEIELDNMAEMAFSDWWGRVTSAMKDLVRSRYDEHPEWINPYSSVSSVMRDYANALTDAQHKLLELRNTLLINDTIMAGTSADLQRAVDSLRSSGSQLNQKQNALPASIRGAIEGGDTPAQPAAQTASRGVDPVPGNPISQFYDPSHYNWMTFENTSSQPVHVVFIPFHPGYGGGAADIGPGRKTSTGDSQREMEARGGYQLYICPAGSIPIDVETGRMVNRVNRPYRCKAQ
jgi:hypothetical protein